MAERLNLLCVRTLLCVQANSVIAAGGACELLLADALTTYGEAQPGLH